MTTRTAGKQLSLPFERQQEQTISKQAMAVSALFIYLARAMRPQIDILAFLKR